MTLTRAMAKAQELHPVRSLPKRNAWENSEDDIEAFAAANRIRASLTNDSWPHKVFAFHRLFRVATGGEHIAPMDAFRQRLRTRLRHEENRETDEAAERYDTIEQIDGLLDLIYVCLGELIELGMTPDEINLAMEEVHASNMTKVDSNGQPVFDDGGKVLKGDHYVRVNLHAVLGNRILAQETTDGEGNNSVAS